MEPMNTWARGTLKKTLIFFKYEMFDTISEGRVANLRRIFVAPSANLVQWCKRCNMTTRLDLTGKTFGRLTVTGYAYFDKYHYWHCVCECGRELDVIGFSLTSGNTRSCGCLKREVTIEKRHASRKYQGAYDSSGHSRIYTTWLAMIHRCSDPHVESYPRYGGRGIGVCDEWLNFQTFHDWAVSNGYSDELSIDRIGPDGDYCPENCRWADSETQNNNRRDNVFLEYDGRRMTIAQWSRELGVSKEMLYKRHQRGWSDADILCKQPQAQ